MNDSVGHIHQTILDEISEKVSALPQEKRETVDRKLTVIINDIESFFKFFEKIQHEE